MASNKRIKLTRRSAEAVIRHRRARSLIVIYPRYRLTFEDFNYPGFKIEKNFFEFSFISWNNHELIQILRGIQSTINNSLDLSRN